VERATDGAARARVEGAAVGAPARRPPDVERWVDEHADAMYRFALLRLGSGEAAEDAVQEAFLAAVGSAGRFDGRSSVRTWLIGILRNKVVDAIRRERSERRAREAIASDDGLFEGGQWAVAQGGRAWPARGTPEWAELRSALEEGVLELPSPMREAFCLRVLDGASAERVGSALGISQSNVWTLVHRAKLRLRAWLDERWFGRAGGE
jgi:RNA polymerase sigma factor (sigma-70 family)